MDVSLVCAARQRSDEHDHWDMDLRTRYLIDNIVESSTGSIAAETTACACPTPALHLQTAAAMLSTNLGIDMNEEDDPPPTLVPCSPVGEASGDGQHSDPDGAEGRNQDVFSTKQSDLQPESCYEPTCTGTLEDVNVFEPVLLQALRRAALKKRWDEEVSSYIISYDMMCTYTHGAHRDGTEGAADSICNQSETV
ncbi:hypothetical protein C8Q76DRAFT_803102 [Earliella scabrosa]|nr:hypothetical protein C8Q76DRAFT_803102 [Earliella scabrosa]